MADRDPTRELEERKEVGNNFMKAGKLELARDIYFSILLDIESLTASTTSPSSGTSGAAEISSEGEISSLSSTTKSSSYQDLQIACLNNLSALFYQSGNYSEVLQLTNRTLSIQPTNVKALYRQAQAYEKLNLPSVAIEKISALLEIEPNNKQGMEYLMKLMEGKHSNIVYEEKEIRNKQEEEPIEGIHVDESKMTPSSSEESLDATMKSSLPPDYGFMNTSWLTQPTLPSSPSPSTSLTPSTSASVQASDTFIQTFQSEVEKNKIKNSIFQSALSSFKTSSTSPHSQDGTSPKSLATIPTSQRVKSTFHELQLEEEELKNQQKAKVGGKEEIHGCPPAERRKKSSRTGGVTSLKSKKVISKTAQDEWAMLMKEEEDMKQLVEEKKVKSIHKRR